MEKKKDFRKYIHYIQRKKEARKSVFFAVFYFVFITLLLLFGTRAHAQTPGIYVKVADPKSEVLIRPMERMMNNIYNLKMTGDFDKDYVAIMKEFEEGGKDLSGIYAKAGEDPRLVENAKVSKVQLKEHQNQLKGYYAKANPTGPRMHGEMIQTLNTMLHEMKRKSQSGNFNTDYASVMVLYNWAGTELAKSELRYGNNCELKSFSSDVLEEFASNENELMGWFSQYCTASK